MHMIWDEENDVRNARVEMWNVSRWLLGHTLGAIQNARNKQ